MMDGIQKRECVARRLSNKSNMVKHRLYHDGLEATYARGANPRVAILKPQIDIIKASMEAFTTNSDNDESMVEG